MKRFAFALALALAVGCHAQVPPATTHTVTLTWSQPAPNANWTGCTTAAPCTYGIYKCTLSQTACADTTNAGWSEVTTSLTRVSGLTFTDSNVGGGTVYYVAKTFQGTASSGPSNISQAIVPGTPTAPPLNTSVASVDSKPLAPVPGATELAMATVTLKARVR